MARMSKVKMEPITPGTYKTRNGRTATVTDVNGTMADGFLEPKGKAKRRGCCWWVDNGLASGGGRAYWDLVERVPW